MALFRQQNAFARFRALGASGGMATPGGEPLLGERLITDQRELIRDDQGERVLCWRQGGGQYPGHVAGTYDEYGAGQQIYVYEGGGTYRPATDTELSELGDL